jgi:IS30 family transposase
MINANHSQREIAAHLGFSQSTISKELKRNRGPSGSYEPFQAHAISTQRQEKKPRRHSVLHEALCAEVIHRLERRHSPQQISGALARNGTRLSPRTIYNHLYRDKLAGGQLHRHLRINGRRRYRHRNRATRHKIPNRREISERPAVVESRERYGDWEVDLIEGARGSGYLLSLYERKSRLGKLVKMAGKTRAETVRAILGSLRGYCVHTLTYDNGLEFAQHERINRVLSSQSYFCQPYASWEKGGVENYNGLVRDYFPKGTRFDDISVERLKEVEREINERPRAILNYLSAANHETYLTA